MGIIKFGTHSTGEKSRALVHPASIARAAKNDLNAGESDVTVGEFVEVGGDFTRGVGQGLGIVLGLVGAGWIATKMLR